MVITEYTITTGSDRYGKKMVLTEYTITTGPDRYEWYLLNIP